jgi:thiamine-monophosphate kinase
LYRGILDALEATEARIIGGNLTSCGPEWFVDITVAGRIEQGRALTRAGARPGDRILVTGSPGRSAAGLAILLAVTESEALAGDEIEAFLALNPWAQSLVRAFREPQARLAAARRLAKAADRPVTALLDISDGLLGDLAHICERSGVRSQIEVGRLPRDPDLDAAATHFGRTRASWTLSPGDDYELLMTVRPAASERVANELRSATGLMVTEIGEILPADSPARDPGADADLVDVLGVSPGNHLAGGWEHFRARS